MKIAAVLFILSVCYIAGTEQAAVPAGVHTYPSRSWHKEMERKAQQGMKDFKMNAEEYVYPQATQLEPQTTESERPAFCDEECCE